MEVVRMLVGSAIRAVLTSVLTWLVTNGYAVPVGSEDIEKAVNWTVGVALVLGYSWWEKRRNQQKEK